MLPKILMEQFHALFSQYPEVERVFVYGSYAKGTNHAQSDIDLALTAPMLTDADFARLWYTVTYEMPGLIPIELARLDGAADDFSQRVRQKGVVIYERRGACEKSADEGAF